MKFRWFSGFTLIGILLLIMGIAGLVLQHSGQGFVFDPGQPPPAGQQDLSPWYYIIIGVLMLINGLVEPAPVSEEKTSGKNKKPQHYSSANGSQTETTINNHRDTAVNTIDTKTETNLFADK